MSEIPSSDLGNWDSGIKKGSGAPERMGDWTKEDVSETPNQSADNEALDESKLDLTDDSGMTRRDFIKNLAGASAAIATLGAVGPKAAEYLQGIGEKDLTEKTEELKSKTIKLKVPNGFGIDHFYQRSGWNVGEKSIDATTYREIVKKINNLENSSLIAGAEITIPIRDGNSLEGSN
ncbi:twin-arginine translocation signal domain-containing protein [Patescibacteria group bacterium]|nr:twin-arginine translocation signal domain-containing protein [Patescibacteria group bacterium]